MSDSKPTERLRELAQKIGQFYLEKNQGDYDKACQAIKDLQITHLELIETGASGHPEVLAITLPYVGKLVGRRGENIDKLILYLGVKVRIFEDIVWPWLLPVSDQRDLEDLY